MEERITPPKKLLLLALKYYVQNNDCHHRNFLKIRPVSNVLLNFFVLLPSRPVFSEVSIPWHSPAMLVDYGFKTG